MTIRMVVLLFNLAMLASFTFPVLSASIGSRTGAGVIHIDINRRSGSLRDVEQLQSRASKRSLRRRGDAPLTDLSLPDSSLRGGKFSDALYTVPVNIGTP
jgi:hypothetical protein